MSEIDRDAWLSAVAAAGFHATADDRDAVTIKEFAEMLGVGRSRAEDRMRQLVDQGMAVTTQKRIVRCDGAQHPVPAYRLVQKESPHGANTDRHRRRRDTRRSGRDRSSR